MNALGKDITWALAAKVVGLVLLWWLCFSNPIAHSLRASHIKAKLFGQPHHQTQTHSTETSYATKR